MIVKARLARTATLRRALFALVAAAVAGVVIWWLDRVVLRPQLPIICGDLEEPCTVTYLSDYSPVIPYLVYLVTAGASLLVAALAWRSRSVAVGTIYLVLGGMLALLPLIQPSIWRDYGPHDPLRDRAVAMLRDIWGATNGSHDLLGLLGAAMAIAGIVVIVRSLVDWVAAGEPGRRTAGPAA